MQDVVFWDIRERKNRKKKWEVRWKIGGTVEKSKSFTTKEYANNYLTKLRAAAKAGEEFDVVSGVPASWDKPVLSVFDAVVGYARGAWPDSSGNTRRTTTDNGVRLIMAGVVDTPAVAPADAATIRAVVGRWALRFDRNRDRAAEGAHRAVPRVPAAGSLAEQCLAWVRINSRPVADIADEQAALEFVTRASRRLDGQPGAGDTMRRRRSIFSGALDYATTHGALPVNPLKGVTVRRARSSDAVNPRTVPDWDQAERLLDAINTSKNATDRFLWAFFVLSYLTGMRPGETRALRKHDIIWPEHITDPDAVEGWGLLILTGGRTQTDADYTDSGETGEDRPLKGRAAGDIRQIPLPPDAITALRHHLATYDTAPDGRLFYHPPTHGVLPGACYRRTWNRARKTALTPAETTLGVATTPYTLRHACASELFALTIPTPEIARRLGHTVAQLETTYVHWFKHQEHAANRKLQTLYQERGPITGQTPTPTPTNQQNPTPTP